MPSKNIHICLEINDVTNWMSSNRLQLNTSKSEILWCTSAQWQSQLPTSPFRAWSDYV